MSRFQPRAVVERLMEKVLPEPNSGCWLWDGATYPNGYPAISHRGNARPAHRVAYEALQGPIPAGLVIDHLCRVPLCVNPAHLDAVPQAVNVARGRVSEVKTKLICVRGHVIAEHQRMHRKGWRYCAACSRERARDHHIARRGAA